MKDAWSKANVLLELLLNPSSPGTLFKDHLLVHFIFPKGVDRNQIRSRKTERFRTAVHVRAPHLLLYVLPGCTVPATIAQSFF